MPARFLAAFALFVAILMFASVPLRSPGRSPVVLASVGVGPPRVPALPPTFQPGLQPASVWKEAVRRGIRQPRQVETAALVYPEAARQARIEGIVVLEVLIDEGGRVADTRVLRSVPILDEAAIDTVRRWRFAPTLVDDEPVKVVMTVTLQFALRG